MQKRVIPIALAVMILLAGCGGVDAVLTTDLTTFDVVGLEYYSEYNSIYGGDLVATEDNRMLVVTMTAQSEFDETSFKSYFCADNGSSVARLFVDQTEVYDCIAVGYQEGSDENTILYVLVFDVPSTVQKAKLIVLEAPGHPHVALKGKLPEDYVQPEPREPVDTSDPDELSPDDSYTDELSPTDDLTTDGIDPNSTDTLPENDEGTTDEGTEPSPDESPAE